MTIKNERAYLDGVWDWAILDGCFGHTRIQPTDIDGCVERKGRKLFIETKAPGVPVKLGQMITLMGFVSDGHTVLIVWGPQNIPQKIRLITPFSDRVYEPADIDKLRWLVRCWFEHAENNGQDNTEPSMVARTLWRSKGRAYCDEMMAEFVRLDEVEKRSIHE